MHSRYDVRADYLQGEGGTCSWYRQAGQNTSQHA